MGQTIKVKCNGPNKDVNDVDVDRALREDSIAKGGGAMSQSSYPERIVLRCRACTDGRVIITREMLENFFENNKRG